MNPPNEFDAAVVFGRFNLLHRGHTALFDSMAQKAGVVIVGLSDNDRNIEARHRVRVIKDAMNDMGINFRVLTADQPFAFFEQVNREYPDQNIMSMFGEDQYKLGKAAERVYGWVPNVIPRLKKWTPFWAGLALGVVSLPFAALDASIISSIPAAGLGTYLMAEKSKEKRRKYGILTPEQADALKFSKF